MRITDTITICKYYSKPW